MKQPEHTSKDWQQSVRRKKRFFTRILKIRCWDQWFRSSSEKQSCHRIQTFAPRYPQASSKVDFGATDGAYLRGKAVQAYGVGSYIENGESLAHGNDERVSLEGVGKFLEFVYYAVIDVAGAKN